MMPTKLGDLARGAEWFGVQPFDSRGHIIRDSWMTSLWHQGRQTPLWLGWSPINFCFPPDYLERDRSFDFPCCWKQVRTPPDSWSAVKKNWQLKEGEKEARREEKMKGMGKEQDRQPRLKLLSAVKRAELKKEKKAKKAKSKDEKSLHPQWAHQLPLTRTLDLSHPEKQKEQWKQRERKEELRKDGASGDGRVGKGQNVNRRKREEKRNE
uniref:Uncharacterized protein n=1 Tax=Chromera velia CCMP2878 TaxID=1169474 RepID=A0A0G4GNC9_9ALVE|eukprot:Cvel_4970.t1-p1 / transcript=Cvel_4970.t1 / gene=Cvel_4970 / organism=Chromera_velia_CCMP2878 / gene_product=hypothetical protein / transcript_product=hypothetical protein / location=Cvel_scaffold224:122456-127207(-) / protein_length=209 / sequence_SO=supercontig / SO=protein_coding / is_pseudo=false